MRSARAGIGLLVGLGGPASLPGGGSLEWTAPPDRCPDAATIVSLLREHTRETTIGTHVHANANATQLEDSTWSIDLQLRVEDSEPTTRSFSVGSCDAGAQAVALALALAMQAEEPTPQDDPQPEAPSGPTIVPPPPATPDEAVPLLDPVALPTQPSTEAEPRSRPRATVGVGGGVAGGILPVGGLVTGYVGLLGRRWRVLARFDHEIRRVVELSTRPNAGGRVALFGAAVEAGPVFRVGAVELPLTVGVTAAGLRAVGFGATTNATRTVPWAGLLAGTGVYWAPTPRLALGLRGELVAGLVRHTFGFRPGLALFSTEWVGGRGFAVVEVRLP